MFFCGRALMSPRSSAALFRPGLLLLWLSAVFYLALNQVSLEWVTEVADLDQAEQLVLGQTLEPGYGAQPPLYTYLVWPWFEWLGSELEILRGVKLLTLAVLLGALIGIGAQMGFGLWQQALTLAGVLLIPQFVWESQRDLTHSVLASALAALTLLQVLRMRHGGGWGGGAALGLLAGLALISKYNVVFFIAALGLAVLWHRDYRQVLLRPAVLGGALLAGALVLLPHGLWVAAHPEAVLGGIDKAGLGGASRVHSLGEALLAILAFLSPLWLMALFVLPLRTLGTAYQHARPEVRFLVTVFVIVVLEVVLFALMTGAGEIKDRWVQPMLFFAPVLVAALADPAARTGQRVFVGTALLLALAAALILPGRVLLADRFDAHSRLNLPYDVILSEIERQVGDVDWVAAETTLLGGNARLVFEDARILAPANHRLVDSVAGRVLVLCESPACDLRRLAPGFGEGVPLARAEAKLHFSSRESMRLYWAVVDVQIRPEDPSRL